MHTRFIMRPVLLILALILPTIATIAADTPPRLKRYFGTSADRPLPTLDYVQRAASINANCAYYRGRYHDIDITIETHPNSNSNSHFGALSLFLVSEKADRSFSA